MFSSLGNNGATANGPDVACRSRLPPGLNYTRGDKIRDCATRRDTARRIRLGGPPKILGNVSCRIDERRLANRIYACLTLDRFDKCRRRGRKCLLRLLYAKNIRREHLGRECLVEVIRWKDWNITKDLFCRHNFFILHRKCFYPIKVYCFKKKKRTLYNNCERCVLKTTSFHIDTKSVGITVR